jgi:dTDP-4-dehydrorhamnose reductase
VDIFVRQNPGLQHEKLKVHVIDFNIPEQWQHLVKGDVLFSCLGTTLKAAGSKEAQWKIDFDYQYNFAKAASQNKVVRYVLVSADFASPNSPFYYSKMKGQLEVAVKELKFPGLTIFKPPMLIRKNSDRTGEVIGLKLIKLFNKAGLLRSQKPLPTEVLAQAMINAANKNATGSNTFKGREIWKVAAAE